MILNEKFHSTLELVWKESFMHLMRPTVMRNIIYNNDYQPSEICGEFVKENWSKIDGLTLVDPFRFETILKCVYSTKNLNGDILECGSYKGGTGIMIALFLKHCNIKKKIHLFDSFAGLPDPHEIMDSGYKKGQFISDYDKLVAKISELNLSDDIVIHKGWFNDTIPIWEKSTFVKEISVLHIDCDLYPSTKDSYCALEKYVVNQGAIILDDYNDGGRGEKIAVLEYIEKNTVIHIGPLPQVYYFKGSNQTSTESYKMEDVYYDFAEVLSNKNYNHWLNAELNLNLINLFNMNKQNILAELEIIVGNVVDAEVKLTEEMKASDVENWDSINHIQIIVDLEEKFNIAFSSNEINNFKTIGDMILCIEQKGI